MGAVAAVAAMEAFLKGASTKGYQRNRKVRKETSAWLGAVAKVRNPCEHQLPLPQTC